MNIYPNSSLSGNYSILINVSDKSNLSSFQVIAITIINNSAPVWGNMSSNISQLEENRIYINLSSNVSDSDGNNITFSYTNLSYFPSFSLNSTTGIINFTTNDLDVGRQIIIINASDGVAQSSIVFNFSISNLNESPVFMDVPTGDGVSGNWNMNTTEDAPATIYLVVDDEDLKILQKSYYDESLSISTTLLKNGSLSDLFSFSINSYPYAGVNNRTQYRAAFTANKSYVGNYSVRVNVSDRFSLNASIVFNLSIAEVQHPPNLSFSQSLNYSINERFYLDVNASDLEDGEEFFGSNNTNFTYSITNLSAGGNFLAINSSTGIVTNLSGASNFSLNQSSSYPGNWTFNVSVRDMSGLNSSRTFNIKVYDYPLIFYPALNYIFGAAENTTSTFNFTANHSVGDNLNYSIYIRGVLRVSGSGPGNGSAVYLNITPNWTDETGACAGNATLVLNVSNQKLSNLTNWSVTINHTNYPLRTIKDISIGGSINISGTGSITLYLNEYFEDIDASDTCHNQTIGFKHIFVASNGSNESLINVSVINWTNRTTPKINFSSQVNASAFYYLNVSEFDETNGSRILNTNLSTNRSNLFIITLIESTSTQEVPTSGGGSSAGSSGGGTTQVPAESDPILLKIVLPGPVSISQKGKIILPISLINEGIVDLRNLSLRSFVAINGSLVENITSFFDRDAFPLLAKGKKEEFNLTVNVDTDLEGLYEITVNVSVENPKYSDWGKIYMNVKKGTTVKEKFIFVQELVVNNPECAEIKELVDRARESLESGDIKLAEKQITDAVNACSQAIAQKSNPRRRPFSQETLLNYVSLATIGFLVLGIAYYLYRRGKFLKEAGLVDKEEDDRYSLKRFKN
jgi:hypothetical protein